MNEASRFGAAVLALCGFAACADGEATTYGDPAASRSEDPGVIDGGAPSLDAAVDEERVRAADVDAGANDAGRARPDASVTVKDPNGAYFADVTANGTGCPAGTWTTNLTPDGQSFYTTFSSFEAEVDRSRAISIKDCSLAIKIHSPGGISYTVEDFYFGGYMYLEPGVSARMQSSYYFTGSPAESAEIITDVEGPQDKKFLVQDTRDSSSFVRSRCGTEQTLNVRMSLRLRNSNPRGNGYMNIWEAPTRGRGPGDFGLKLSWKRCNP